MRRVLVVAAALAALGAAGAGAAWADGSNGKGHPVVEATCTTSGDVVIHVTSGQSAWVDDSHWVVQSFSGTFTDSSGASTSFSKTYGSKSGFASGLQECTGTQTYSDGSSFSFDTWVAPTPAGG